MNTTQTFRVGVLALAMVSWFGCQDALTDLDASRPALQVQASSTWDYNINGPSAWPDIFPESCAAASQSPIDVAIREVAHNPSLPELHFEYEHETTLDIFNNTRTVEAALPLGGGVLKIGDGEYELEQFHFHTPSEHQLDGRSFPAEMHLVHKNAEGNLAVVGVLIATGGAHPELAEVWADLPGVYDPDHRTLEDFDLATLLPEAEGSFRYAGSLTTPPCTEGVSWIVMRTLLRMSSAQLSALQEIFADADFPDGNRRPVQPLNGRVVEGVK